MEGGSLVHGILGRTVAQMINIALANSYIILTYINFTSYIIIQHHKQIFYNTTIIFQDTCR